MTAGEIIAAGFSGLTFALASGIWYRLGALPQLEKRLEKLEERFLEWLL